jgi:hypothetical protein
LAHKLLCGGRNCNVDDGSIIVIVIIIIIDGSTAPCRAIGRFTSLQKNYMVFGPQANYTD